MVQNVTGTLTSSSSIHSLCWYQKKERSILWEMNGCVCGTRRKVHKYKIYLCCNYIDSGDKVVLNWLLISKLVKHDLELCLKANTFQQTHAMIEQFYVKIYLVVSVPKICLPKLFIKCSIMLVLLLHVKKPGCASTWTTGRPLRGWSIFIAGQYHQNTAINTSKIAY